MIVSRVSFSVLAALIFTVPSTLSGQGYRIEVNMEGLSNDTLILGEYFTSKMIPKDTLVLDKSGYGIFEGPETFQGGLYLIYVNPNHFFDLLLGDDQVMAIKADTSDFSGSIEFEGSEDNLVFYEYKNHLQQKRAEQENLHSMLTTAATESDSTTIQEKLKQINLEMQNYIARLVSEHSSLFVSDFIGATREPVPPDELLNGQKRHDDSVKYYYYREHYFDHFNPFDVRLLHTPLYEGKLKNFITRAVTQHPDSLIDAVDFLLEGSKADDNLYRYNLITLFNHFAESKFMGMDVVYFHIAEHYYIPDATWSSPDFISKLKDNLEKNKPILIGQIAPNLMLRKIPPEHFGMAALDTTIKRDPHIGQDLFIHNNNNRFTILYFWEADCGHCKKSTPALHQVYSRIKEKDVEVVSVHAINTLEGKEKWVDFINEHQMYDWINCWSPYSNEFRKRYNLQSYPQLFILDREKKIVAKGITPEQAENIINSLIQREL